MNSIKITNKEQLHECLNYEKKVYGITVKSFIWGYLTQRPLFKIWLWLYYSRKSDYYAYKYTRNRIYKPLYMYYLRKKNVLSFQLGFDIDTVNIGKGLLIYHAGATVINGKAIIGEDCVLHGNNCIGNKGPAGSDCPIIGDRVEIGVGAKIVGGVKLPDDCVVGAGAIVVNSYYKKGDIIVGVPAKALKNRKIT